MKAIVLAVDAGVETRPGTEALPPALLPNQGELLLIRTLRWLKRYDVADVALHLHHEPEAFKHVVGYGAAWGLTLAYVVEPHPQGTAAVLKQLEPFFDDTCVVVYGHLLLDVDLAALLDYHRSRNALVTIGLTHADDPRPESVVECESGGKVIRFVRHPAQWLSEQRTVATGLYLVEPAVLEQIPTDRPFDLEDHLLPLLVTAGDAIYGQLVDGPVANIGTAGTHERVKDTGSVVNEET